ncbi:MAG: hypothetical protein AAGD33_08655 [Actinomycetota bacterium]
MTGDVAHIDVAAPRPDVDDATEATRELAAEFARALTTGDGESARALLAESVAVLVSGRGPTAGRHDGREEARSALLVDARPDVVVDTVDVAEVLADGRRALVVIAQSGSIGPRPVAWETAFHLQTDGERIVGVTEYSGDQYVADEVTSVPVMPNEGRWWRWRARSRRARS